MKCLKIIQEEEGMNGGGKTATVHKGRAEVDRKWRGRQSTKKTEEGKTISLSEEEGWNILTKTGTRSI